MYRRSSEANWKAEGKIICNQILESLIADSMGDNPAIEELSTLRFVSDCYFTTVTNLVNMIYLPMDIESERCIREALMGTFRKFPPRPKPSMDD